MFRMRSLKGSGLLARLVASGGIEAALAAALAVLSLTLNLGTSQPWPVALLDLSACAVAAATPRWPRIANGVLCALLLGYLALPPEWGTMGEYAMLIPILGAGMRGNVRIRTAMSVASLAIFAALAWQSAPSPAITALGAVAWGFLIGVLWLIGNAFVAVTEAQRRARAVELLLQRQHLARELHDTVARSLTAVTMAAEQARLRGGATDAELAQIADSAADSLQELRLVMNLLRDPVEPDSPLDVRRTPLGEALAVAKDDLTRNGFALALNVDGNLGRLTQEQADVLGAATGEAVNNMIKHGDPAAPCAIVADIIDAGIELAFVNRPLETDQRHDPDSSLGLWGMQQRLAAIGGEVSTESTPTHWITRLKVPTGSIDSSPERAA